MPKVRKIRIAPPDSKKLESDPGSFRDPAGRVFFSGDRVLRNVSKSYLEQGGLLPAGVIETLVEKKQAHPFHLVEPKKNSPSTGAWIESERIEPWSYPYEWSRSQLADAALLTLDILQTVFQEGFTLKDASAYNVQFIGAVPIFIDSLSFEKRKESSPWLAYRQFCTEFVAPLALSRYSTDFTRRMLTRSPSGVPLDVVVKALPLRSYFNFNLLMHLHLHASLERKSTLKMTSSTETARLSDRNFGGLIESLRWTIKSLRGKERSTFWSRYYTALPSYTGNAFEAKEKVFRAFVKKAGHQKLSLDLGCNTGHFSRLMLEHADQVVAADKDDGAVDHFYRELNDEQNRRILPLCLDLASPSPGLGWRGQERSPFFSRIKPELVSALALMHHVCITDGIPISDFMGELARISTYAIVEWVPPSDPMAKMLLDRIPSARDRYTFEVFETAVGDHFRVVEKVPLQDSERILYLLKVKA